MQSAAMKGLFRRYVATIVGLVSVSVLTVGSILAFYHYSQDQQRAHEVQIAEARAASASIDAYLRDIEGVLRSLSNRLAEGAAAGRDAQARDFRDALKFEPAILNIRSLDSGLLETNFVSRLAADRIESRNPQPEIEKLLRRCSTLFCYGPTFIRDQTEPFVIVAVRGSPGGESLAAEISVRFIDDILARLSIGKSARAYIVDLNGHLLAHPDLRTLLRNTDVSSLPQVRAVRNALSRGLPELPSVWGKSPDGGAVFSSATRIFGPDWLLYVEQPSAEVLRTVKTTIGVTMVVLGIGIAAAGLASLLLAQRLAKPILQLRDGAQRLGSGDLSAKIEIHSRDEIQSVAAAFNGMADSLRTLYESLESKVLERTRDLAQANDRITTQAQELSALNGKLEAQLDELKIKREAADRANAAKTRFVATASHDLRQPMHAVGLLVGILAERQISPDISSLLNKIQLSVSALESLFETLLDISRLDAGIVTPHLTCVSLDFLLESIELSHSQAATDKGLTLRVHRSRTLVHTDSALLLSMLGNLVSNAIRYSERGRIDVYCRKHRGFVTVHVCDTGIGIPTEELAPIFEEFYQLNDTRRARGQGLGLGLAIVRRTAELLGYGLSAKSSMSVGSVFGIRLPIATTEQFRLMAPVTVCAQDSVLTGAFIVVVDDDQESRFATEAIFKSWRCHVISGESGAAVRHELSQHLRQPDLIVADYWLGNGETGLAIIQDLRRDAEMRIPAIILTADQAVASTLLARAHDIVVLQKPANAQRIRRVVMDLIPQTANIERQAVSSEFARG
ncbi:MAG TPA: ATP-binding protein [Steroidobacteraceae bacterium]|nr:ATP-binding protein [Steroidobacteraceae bacterium]